MTKPTGLTLTTVLAIFLFGGCTTSHEQNLVKGEKRQGVSDRYIIGTPGQEQDSTAEHESPAN